MSNPFTLDFGIKPEQFISRISQTREIISTFDDADPSRHIFMITGVRGSGKTVLLSSISSTMAEKKNWYVIELNPSNDMLESFVGKIYSIPGMKRHFLKAKLDFSAFGLGISIEDGLGITDIEVALEKMLSEIRAQGKRLLILIDEVAKNKEITIFSHSFQMYLKKELPVFLLMTGLYENIYELQNEKSLTFLYRAPKLILEPLNAITIANSYEKILSISEEESIQMSKLTKGYPFAYQVLGYLYWENKPKRLEDILPLYDQHLSEYVYEKIWSELSELDRKIMIYISQKQERIRIKDIRAGLSMDSGLFSVYRDRLFRKGILDVSEYGYVSVALPRFSDFVRLQYKLM